MNSDAELLARYQAGRSHDLFNQIVERHGPMVLRTCRRLVHQAEDAEDAAQATFQALARRPESVDAPLGAWLYGVARRAACDLVRASSRRVRREEIAARMRISQTAPATDTDGWREEIDAALADLPAALREAVVLRYLEGRQQAEAARLAGVPQGTMARRSMEGLNQLRAILARRGAMFSVATLTVLLTHEAAAAAATTTALVGLKTWAAGLVLTGGEAVSTSASGGAASALTWLKMKWLMIATAGMAAAGVTATVALQSKPAGPPTTLTATLQGHDAGILSTALSPDGLTLATASSDRTIKLWDLASQQEITTLPGHERDVAAVVYLPDGLTLISGSDDGVVKRWDVATRRETASVQAHPVKEGVSSLALTPAGDRLVTGGWDGTLKLWDAATLTPRNTLHGHTSGVCRVVFAPDGTQIASASNDGTLRLWDTASGDCLHVLKGHHVPVTALAWSPDGATLAAGDRNGMLKLWDVATRQPRRSHQAHQGEVLGLAWSADGRWLASGGTDRLARIWDVATGQELAALGDHGHSVSHVAFAPDGRLFTGSYDKALRIWGR